MVNQEILGGLKLAINRGEPLQKAMITFYNAGYKKEEIEEATKALQQEKIPSVPLEIKKPKKIKKGKIPLSPKKISSYGGPTVKPKRKIGKWFLIAFLIIGLIFVGLLIAFILST